MDKIFKKGVLGFRKLKIIYINVYRVKNIVMPCKIFVEFKVEILKTSDLSGATLYENLTACTMCFSVANWAGITKIVSGARKTEDMVKKGYYEGKTAAEKLNEENNRKIELVFIPDFEQESLDLIKDWESHA